VETNFGRSRQFSLGVEEEFQLLHAETYELASRYGEVEDAVDAAEQEVKPELLQSVAETATPVAATAAEVIDGARELRRRLRDAAEERDSLIAAAGTHPFSRYEHQDFTQKGRYLELGDAMQWVAERMLIFGTHVHIGVDSADKAVAVANALRTWLPELLALSANSPFWQARDTGLAATRIKVFDTFPRSGLPPSFASFEEFRRLVERGIRTKSFSDYTYLWWDLRPHPKLGTIEVRICDAQTRLENLTAIVALVQSLVATLAERWERDGRLPVQPALLIDENRWRAARHGLAGELIDLERDEEVPSRQAVLALVERAEEAARRLGCAVELAEVARLCERGTGADEQRRRHEETGSLLAVAQWLAAETVQEL
jgi:carboxylate-amine ligase